jgi:hypothetical protein
VSIDKIIEQKIKKLNEDLEKISYLDLKPYVENELKKSVVKNIYGRPEGDYDRTGMMYDSITGFARKSNEGLEIYAIMDMENTKPRHTSWVSGTESNKGTEIDKHLAYWSEYGTDYGLAPIEGTLMFAEAQEFINKKATKLLKKKLKSIGYKVK